MEKKPKDYNPKSPGVRRILREAFELSNSTYQYYAQPLEENIYEWHFTIRGPDDTEFQGGIYHGRILLPNDYPMKPPNFIFLTQNGRFDINRKICLNISGFHPESWQPCWSIRTVLLAIISFLPVPYDGSVGSINYPVEERKKLAKLSRKFTCDICQCKKIADLLKPEPVNDEAHNSQWYKDFQVYIQNLTAEHSNSKESAVTSVTTSQPSSISQADNDAIVQINSTESSLSNAENSKQIWSETDSNISNVSSTTSKVSTPSEASKQSTNTSNPSVTASELVSSAGQIPSPIQSVNENSNRTIIVEHTFISSNSIIETLRGPTGEIMIWICFGLTFAIVMRRIILNFYGIED